MDDEHEVGPAIAVMTAWESGDSELALQMAAEYADTRPNGGARLVRSLMVLCDRLLELRDDEQGKAGSDTLREIALH